jgi:hypothetical protein
LSGIRLIPAIGKPNESRLEGILLPVGLFCRIRQFEKNAHTLYVNVICERTTTLFADVHLQ